MKYQGKEFRTYIQANSEEALDEMLSQTQKYSKRIGTGSIRILEKKRDPEGGWEATVVAHNWDPIGWIKEKFGGKREEVGPELSYEERLDVGEEEELLRVRREQLEEEKIEKEKGERYQKELEELEEEYQPSKKESSEDAELRRFASKLGELKLGTAKAEAEAKLAELEATKEKWIKTPEDVEATRQELARKREVEAEKREEEKKKLKREGRERVAKKVLATYKAILGPMRPVSKDWYIPKQMPEYYVPGGKVRKLTDPTGAPAGEMHRPDLYSIRRAGAPPPSTLIRAPFRDVEKQEGLGSALGRLRQMGKFPKVDWAVYSEIHANGDIDTPSHIKKEVGQLGFSKKEINDSLTRLRKLGIIAPTGLVVNGEKELMVTGGTDGR